MPDELIGAIIAVAGAIIGAWYSARLSRQAAQDLLSQQAKAEFSSAFTGALIKLHSEISNPGEGRALFILQEDFPSHFAAYLKLRVVVPKKEQQTIDAAWKRYAQEDEYELPEERTFYRFSHVLEPHAEEHQNLLSIKHINILLNATAT